MYRYKTIIFDLDGTLFKTDSVFVESLNEVCASRDIEKWEAGKISEMIGIPMVQICKVMFGENLSDEEIENIRHQVRLGEKRLLPDKGELYPNTIEMLNNLKAHGYKLCICSNGSKPHVENVLNAFGIMSQFDIIKTRIEGVTKSQLIQEILQESLSTSAIMVGDRHIDFEAADVAGCFSIGVSYGYGADECEHADMVAHNANDIPQLINQVNEIYSVFLKEILLNKPACKPIIVGINGVDASGKTTLTRNFSRYLKKQGYKAQVINIDDFHNPSCIRYRHPDPIISYIENAFDLSKLERELLIPIKECGLAEKSITHLNLQTDEFSLSKAYKVDGDTIVLIEGVLLYREPIDKYFDYRIFLDISYEEVIRRAAKRDIAVLGEDVASKYDRKYIPIQKKYMEQCMPKEKSDIVLSNENYNCPQFLKVVSK